MRRTWFAYQLLPHSVSQATHKYPYLILKNDIGEVLALSESAAICQFLCQHEQRFIIKTDQNEFWDFCYLQHFSEAMLMPILLMKQVYAHTTQRTPWLLRWVSLSFQYSINRFY